MKESFFATLRPASFRGVLFEVDSHTESGGRRLARHEYPLRDLPFAEDLGRKAGQWQIEAFLVHSRNADYAQSRDNLREALNAAGSGTLIHPYLGECTVAVESFSLRESTREGGYCTFSIAFVESGQPDEPDVALDTAGVTLDQAEVVANVAEEGFLSTFSPMLDDLELLAGTMPRILDEALGALSVPFAMLEQARQIAVDVLMLPETLLAEITGRIGNLANIAGLLSVSSLPLVNLDSLTSLFARRTNARFEDSFGGTGGTGGSSSGGAGGNGGGSEDKTSHPATSVSTTASRAIIPLVDLAVTAVVVAAAKTAAQKEYATANDALADRDQIASAIDVVQTACSDRVFTALSDLRVATQQDLTTRGAQLPRLAATRLFATMPALAVAHALYDDASRAQEIVTRNRVRHPGRVPGGVDLEVIRG